MNKVMLIGNVGKEPEVKYVDAGVCVASVRLATTERGYTLQNGTEVPDRTEWHNVVCWRTLAEIAEKILRKGTQIYVEGKLQTRSWEDKDGNKRYITEVVADNFTILGNRTRQDEPAHHEPDPLSSILNNETEPLGDLPF